MKTWNLKHLWQATLHKIARKLGLYGTLDSDRAIRALKVENLDLKQQLAQHRGFAKVEIYAPPPTIASYEPPDPTTYGKVAVQGIRSRAMTRQLREHPGKLTRHEHRMDEQKKHVTRKLDVPTEVLESMPPHLRKYSFVAVDPSEPLPGDTLHIPAAWIL